jgi:3-oxoacyl-[acyl-carrier protein] reductase
MAGRHAGKVSVVTGGSRGIGRAIALMLAAEGAKAMICSRRQEAAEMVASEIRSGGGEVTAMRADMAQRSDAEALITGCVERFGRLDILVNNAAITKDALVVRMMGNPGQANYVASKAGLNGFTRTVAREVAGGRLP